MSERSEPDPEVGERADSRERSDERGDLKERLEEHLEAELTIGEERAGSDEGDDEAEEIPREVITEAVRLTRLARRALDDAEAEAYREDRNERVREYGFRARVREEDTREVLVLYPEEWMADGTVQLERVEDTERAIERTLSGSGDADEYERVDAHNREVVERVREEHGDVHAENATKFADYMGNYYVREVGSATESELREFLEEYYPRNAFPTDEEREVVAESLRYVFEMEGRDPPPAVEEGDAPG